MRIGFTGTQVGLTATQRDALQATFSSLGLTELWHGDCIGADAQACRLAQYLGAKTIAHPCNINVKRAHTEGNQHVFPPDDPLRRNRTIVNACLIIVACPKRAGEELRSGTWSTVRYARRVKRRIIIVFPDGTTRDENILWKPTLAD